MEDFFRSKFRLQGLLAAGGFCAALATLAGFMGRFAWWLELASHFRVQYALFFLALAGVYALGRRWEPALASLAFALLNAATFLPYFIPVAAGDVPVDGVHRAVMMNVNTYQGSPEVVAAAILEVDPDVLLLVEVSEQWMRELEPVLTRFPYSKAHLRDDNFGIALLSRLPWTTSEVLTIGEAQVQSVYALISIENESVLVMGTHLHPPVTAVRRQYRNEQFDRIAEFLVDREEPVLLFGDLNMTPWSPRFRPFLRESGLKDSMQGWGIQPTWPTGSWFMRIPIDHCLHSDGIAILNREVGDHVESDHFPLIIDFAVAE